MSESEKQARQWLNFDERMKALEEKIECQKQIIRANDTLWLQCATRICALEAVKRIYESVN